MDWEIADLHPPVIGNGWGLSRIEGKTGLGLSRDSLTQACGGGLWFIHLEPRSFLQSAR